MNNGEGNTSIIVTIAAIVGIVAGGFYIAEHWPNISCFNWFGLAKGCVVTK